jgi:myo-inositol-1(or 4)-monophosphatase
MDLHQKWKLAEETARRAGALITARRDFAVDRKAANDFVTEMDVAAEKLIREALLTACPEDGFFGEETGEARVRAGRFIVDPIDGTTNFVKGIPDYSVSIAYELDGTLRFGVVYNPAIGELFSAFLGEGATLNGERIAVSGETRIEGSLIGMAFSHRNKPSNRRIMRLLPGLCQRVGDLRRLGSAALDLCYVACGRLDAFFELDLNLYDIAAGVLIAREAGAVATGWPGEADLLQTGDVLVATGAVHAFLSEYLSDFPE